jgi:fructose-1,6-bisphosphatase
MDSLSQRDFIGTPDDRSKINTSKLILKTTEIESDD